jgi:hypothetical protein
MDFRLLLTGCIKMVVARVLVFGTGILIIGRNFPSVMC